MQVRTLKNGPMIVLLLLIAAAGALAKNSSPGQSLQDAAAGSDAKKKALAKCICDIIAHATCLPADTKTAAQALKDKKKMSVATADEVAECYTDDAMNSQQMQQATQGMSDAEKAQLRAKVKMQVAQRLKNTAAAALNGCVWFDVDNKGFGNLYFKKLVTIEEVTHNGQEGGNPFTRQSPLTTGDAAKDACLIEAYKAYLEVEAKSKAVKHIGKMLKAAVASGNADAGKIALALWNFMRPFRGDIVKLCAKLPKLGGLAGEAKKLVEKMEGCKKDGKAIFNDINQFINNTFGPKRPHDDIK